MLYHICMLKWHWYLSISESESIFNVTKWNSWGNELLSLSLSLSLLDIYWTLIVSDRELGGKTDNSSNSNNICSYLRPTLNTLISTSLSTNSFMNILAFAFKATSFTGKSTIQDMLDHWVQKLSFRSIWRFRKDTDHCCGSFEIFCYFIIVAGCWMFDQKKWWSIENTIIGLYQCL